MFVKDIMTENPVTATELMTVAEALGLLYELDVRHLPVVRGSELAGIVSDRDLRGFTAPSEDEAIEAIEKARVSNIAFASTRRPTSRTSSSSCSCTALARFQCVTTTPAICSAS